MLYWLKALSLTDPTFLFQIIKHYLANTTLSFAFEHVWVNSILKTPLLHPSSFQHAVLSLWSLSYWKPGYSALFSQMKLLLCFSTCVQYLLTNNKQCSWGWKYGALIFLGCALTCFKISVVPDWLWFIFLDLTPFLPCSHVTQPAGPFLIINGTKFFAFVSHFSLLSNNFFLICWLPNLIGYESSFPLPSPMSTMWNHVLKCFVFYPWIQLFFSLFPPSSSSRHSRQRRTH